MDAAKALQLESEFLHGVESQLDRAKGRELRGSHWQVTRHDETDTLRTLAAQRRVFDRDRLRNFPANRRVCLHGYVRRWLWGKKKTGVAVASTISPLNDLLEGNSTQAKPISLAALTDHVRRIITDPKVPHVIGVCSTSGFEDEVRNAKINFSNTILVLIEPRPGGGWRVQATEAQTPARVLAMFDPEDLGDKVQRVRAEIERRSADLLVGGLSSSALAEALGLPVRVVARALQDAASADAELRLSRNGDEITIYRGAPVVRQERNRMSMVERIRKLFASQTDEAGKINLLAERRAALSQRRDRLYEDIAKLETRESDLLEQGRQNSSQVVRRRLAAQLAQLRKDISRANATGSMLNQQIDIISTDIHNLTLIQQGKMASLPDTEELTENAVRAEEMLESLRADAEMVASLETGMSERMMSDAELEILAEFDAPSKKETAAAQAPQRKSESARPIAEATPPPKEPERRQAGPEVS